MPCQAYRYNLHEVRDSVPSDVEIGVSYSQKFNCEGIYDFNFTSLAIVGEGDVAYLVVSLECHLNLV